MKPTPPHRVLTLASLAALMLLNAGSLSAETMRVALIDYPPFEANPANAGGRWGYMPEVIREIYGGQGIEVFFEFVPWKRALLETENGTYDAMPLANSGHSSLLVFSKEKSAVLKQQFFVKKGSPWRYAGPKSLERITVGWVLGYDYSSFSREYQDYIEKYRDDVDRVIYTAGDTASADMFKKVLSGRVTTFNEDLTFFQYTMRQGHIGRLEDFETAGSLGDNNQYMAFSPTSARSARYAALFDQGIRELRQSGKLKALLDSYGISDWVETNP